MHVYEGSLWGSLMVWKRLIFTLFALAVILAVPITASAEEPYTEGNISTTYVTYFQDILAKSSITDDYVFFRSGQYEYKMYVGDITFENGIFSSDSSCRSFTIGTSSSGYNQTYTFSSSEIGSFSLTTNNALIYSNLGSYPDLIERGEYIETASLLLILVIVCMYLVSRIFSFCIRSRR